MYDRATVIQRTLAAVDGHTYLEIGVGWPDTFLAVKAHEKVGIDPRQPSQLVLDAAAEAISRTVNLPERSTCLEIGTSDEASFLAVRALPQAVNGQLAAGETTPSVFETSLRYFQLTSDQFFASQAHFLASHKIDVAFVDGLHEWRQVESVSET